MAFTKEVLAILQLISGDARGRGFVAVGVLAGAVSV